jgi:hypothetical protein
MRSWIKVVSGTILLSIFILYRIFGPALSGPADKAVQLLLLVPAALFFALYISSRCSLDISKRIANGLVRIPRSVFLGSALLILAVFSIWMAYGPFQGIPKGADEAAYYFQSKIFASGNLAAPVPAVDEPMAHFPFRHFIFHQNRWFIVYTPFHAILMAPLTGAGVAPLLGPLEGLLSLLGLYLLIRLWAGEFMARVSVILIMLSPFFLFMTTTFMAHNTNLMLVTWSLYMISRKAKGAGAGFSVAGGLLIGLAFATKPYPVIAWMIFITLAVVVNCRGRWFSILAPAAAAAAVPFFLFLAANSYYTGDPLRTGYDMVRGGKLIGFGPEKAWFPEYGDYAHTPLRGLMNLIRQIGVGSTIFLGWPFLSLVPILLSIRASLRERRIVWLYLPIMLIMILMWLHYCPAIDYGPRHYFTLMPIAILLSAIGLREAVRIGRDRSGVSGSNFVTSLILGFFLITVLVYIPDGIALRSGPWQTIDRMPDEVCSGNVNTPAIVFMQAGEHGYPHFCSGMNFNSPLLDSDIIYCAHQTTPEDEEFMEAYSGRNCYLYWFDGDNFHLEEWTIELSDIIEPTREMEYYTYLHVPDTMETLQ